MSLRAAQGQPRKARYRGTRFSESTKSPANSNESLWSIQYMPGTVLNASNKFLSFHILNNPRRK